ncbi:hypothetical protein Pint_00079 [Pistacia integerrima]|uniref:Uncharacterized protein n=1 Tax=Pistacia integerrima TaxID=434235 RepID=A0ACC0ZKV1_9ROSI|nr:hypothetical protein Pint_00079 [Pistacia integerrima]
MAIIPENPKIPRITYSEEDNDRISNLPIPILHHILSSLDTLDVIRLSAVSRQWRHTVVKLPPYGGFRRLKYLFLLNVELPNYIYFRIFISSCPFLENLNLHAIKFRDFKTLEISSTSLKKLVIDNNGISGANGDGLKNCELRIACPSLSSFSFIGPLPRDFTLQDVKSLWNVFFGIECLAQHATVEECHPLICKIFKGLCNIKVLKLSVHHWELCLHILYPALAQVQCFSFYNLKSLKLRMRMDDWSMKLMVSLLKCSPNLEALTIYFDRCEFSKWEAPDQAIPCLTYHVKVVELFEVNGRQNELELVRFLLKHGQVLQKMSINWAIDIKDAEEIIPEIMNFPKTSSEFAFCNLRTEPESTKMDGNPKIPRMMGDGNEAGDRFSSLPDPIIHQILSSLETVDVMRLSAVSRKWRYLWISMPYLNLDINTVWSDPLSKWSIHTIIDKFKDFVNWILLTQDRSIDIKRFRLFCHNFSDDTTLYRWLNVVARRNVQELELNIISHTPFELPRCLVNCASLVSLRLYFDSSCVLKLPTCGLSRLKSLDLLRVEFNDFSLLENFISNSPFLEDLIMEACVFREFEILEVSSASLKNLCVHNGGIHDCDGLHNIELQLSCPNLTSFSFIGPSAPDYSFEELHSLKNVFIHLESKSEIPNYQECSYEMCKILEGVCNTEVLKLSVGNLPFLDGLSVPKSFTGAFLNLKSLTILVGMDERHMQALITLLICSPNLEALKIYFEWCGKSPVLPKVQYMVGLHLLCDVDVWEIMDKDISCLTYYLKIVELFEVEGNQNELELLRFLLNKGHVLQKMSINWVRGINDPGEIIPKIMRFPRSSSDVELTFFEPKSDVYFYDL